MTDPFEVIWSAEAEAGWERLRYVDAEAVASAVHRFSTGGECTMIAGEGGSFLLLVGELVVELLVDGQTLHVWRVRRA